MGGALCFLFQVELETSCLEDGFNGSAYITVPLGLIILTLDASGLPNSSFFFNLRYSIPMVLFFLFFQVWLVFGHSSAPQGAVTGFSKSKTSLWTYRLVDYALTFGSVSFLLLTASRYLCAIRASNEELPRMILK